MSFRIETEWHTPAGNRRNVPMYVAMIRNHYLGTERTIRGNNRSSVEKRTRAQMLKWEDQERRGREAEAKRNQLERGEARAASLNQQARETIDTLTGLLQATLAVDDRIDWNELYDVSVPEPFAFSEEPPVAPDTTPKEQAVEYATHPPKPWYRIFWSGFERRWQARCAAIDAENQRRYEAAKVAHAEEIRRCEALSAQHTEALASWSARRDGARRDYQRYCTEFESKRQESNAQVDRFRAAFEAGTTDAVTEYLRGVFERSDYPDAFRVQHKVNFDADTRRAVVTLTVPTLEKCPNVTGYTFVRAKCEARETLMKKRDHAEFYEQVISQILIRTAHEVFEADYVPVVDEVEIAAVTKSIDPATGKKRRDYLTTISATRADFLNLDLRRLDPVACKNSLTLTNISSG